MYTLFKYVTKNTIYLCGNLPDESAELIILFSKKLFKVLIIVLSYVRMCEKSIKLNIVNIDKFELAVMDEVNYSRNAMLFA